ncbi:MAG: hypothetical protein LBL63_00850, partial [Clostridiales Family XIII bacterium]|nr:hypothetical protein [Clostridiales Family XIII bacterium]
MGGATDPVNGLSVKAELDGIDLNGDGGDDSFTDTDRHAEETPQALVVNATFSDDPNVTERTVTVKLGYGLMFSSMQGFNASNVYEDAVAGDLKGNIDTEKTKYEADPRIAMSGVNVTAGSGAVTYVFKDGGAGGVIKSAQITLYVKAAKGFMAKESSRTFKDAVRVDASQKGTGGDPEATDTLMLENYTITGKYSPIFYGDSTKRTQYAKPGGSVAFDYLLSTSGANYSNSNGGLLYAEIVGNFVIPKGLTPAETPITFPTGGYLAAQGAVKSEATKNEDGSHTVKVTMTNVYTHGNSRFTLNVTVDGNVTDGKSLSIGFSQAGNSSTPYEYAGGAGTTVNHSQPPIVAVSTAAAAPEFYQATLVNTNVRAYTDPDGMAPGDMTALANIPVRNRSADATAPQGIKIDFPGSITVRGLRLPVGAPDTV